METIALGRYVADTTGQAAWVGLVAAAGFLPTAFVGLLGGVLADRMSRTKLLAGANLVLAVIAGIVTWLVISDHASPLLLTACALAAGSAGAVSFPSFQAALPDLVEPVDLPAAIGLSSVQWNLGRILGPALAGLLSIRMALMFNTVSFFAVVVAVLAARLPPPAVRVAAPRSIRAQVAEGWTAVRSIPGLRAMNPTMCVNTIIAAPFIALIPAVVNQVLRAGKSANSILVVAQGVGAVIAGLAIGPAVARWGVRRTMVLAVTLTPPALVLYGVAPNLAVMAPCLALVGGCYMLSLSSFSTIAQTLSPPELRGRVMSINNAVLGLLYPVGIIIQGWLGDRVGVRDVTVGSGVLFAVVLVAARLGRPGFTAPVESSAPEVSALSVPEPG